MLPAIWKTESKDGLLDYDGVEKCLEEIKQDMVGFRAAVEETTKTETYSKHLALILVRTRAQRK